MAYQSKKVSVKNLRNQFQSEMDLGSIAQVAAPMLGKILGGNDKKESTTPPPMPINPEGGGGGNNALAQVSSQLAPGTKMVLEAPKTA